MHNEDQCCSNCQYWDEQYAIYAIDSNKRLAHLAYCTRNGDEGAPYVENGRVLMFGHGGQRCPAWEEVTGSIVDLRGLEIPPAEAGLDYPGSLGG